LTLCDFGKIQSLTKYIETSKLDKTSGIVRERMCISIAKISIYLLEVDTFVTSVINYGSQDTHKCLSSLIILQNLPQELEYLAGDVGLRNRKKSEMLMKCHDVYSYLIQVLNSEDMPDEIYKNGFKTVEEWILKTDKFLQHESLLEIVFTAANTKWFVQAKNIMSSAITKSSNAKIFLSASFNQAFQNISEGEQRFLDSVAEFILSNQIKFEQEISDPDSELCKELADLACDL
jgi:hypothetical protein